MATRSRIGIKHLDGSITAIYCHSDGYFSHNGRILHEHWRDAEKVRQLIALGGLSILGEVIGEKHDFEWRHNNEFQTSAGRIDWDKIEKDPRSKYCRAYGRDRGDEGMEAETFSGLAEMERLFEEFLYLYDEGRSDWIACETFHCAAPDELEWHLLSDIVAWDFDPKNPHMPPIPIIRYASDVDEVLQNGASKAECEFEPLF